MTRHQRRGQGRRRIVITAGLAIAVALAVVAGYLVREREVRVSLYAAPGSGTAHRQAAAPSCANPRVVRMNANAQSGVAKGRYYITNDSWNASRYSGLAQAIYVCNYNDWYAVATMNNESGDGAVKTSPNVQETWYPKPAKLSTWASISSRFSDVPPGSGAAYGTWEFEYDIWLNGLADSSSTEVMIWTYNNGQEPGGSLVGSFHDAGQAYVVFRSPPPYQLVTFVARNYRLSGQLNLMDFMRYVVAKGWMPRASSLYQICHGVELVSTNGKPERFAINGYSITTAPR